MIASPVYGEIIDFFAAGTTPDGIIAFRPSQKAKERVDDLIYRKKHQVCHLKSQMNSTITCSLSRL